MGGSEQHCFRGTLLTETRLELIYNVVCSRLSVGCRTTVFLNLCKIEGNLENRPSSVSEVMIKVGLLQSELSNWHV